MITVFYYMMYMNNIQIVLKDGMANRAKYVMGILTDRDELDLYFQKSYLSSDEIILLTDDNQSPYADYTVRGIDHRLDMGFLWLWPWDDKARLTVTEKIPRIDGRAKGSRAEELIQEKGDSALYPPEWPEASYQVLLVLENGQWKIKSLTKISK